VTIWRDRASSVLLRLGCTLLALTSAGVCRGALPKEVDDRGTGPWPIDVQGHVPLAPRNRVVLVAGTGLAHTAHNLIAAYEVE